jgi:hypothetical protein
MNQNNTLLPVCVEKKTDEKKITKVEIIQIDFQLFFNHSDMSLAICVASGTWVTANPSVIENILGNTNKNKANTAIIATIKSIIGYIKAQMYLFFMS